MTRRMAKRLAEQLVVDETQAFHLTLHELAVRLLPQYEADEAPLTSSQMRQIRAATPQKTKRSVRSGLLAPQTA